MGTDQNGRWRIERSDGSESHSEPESPVSADADAVSLLRASGGSRHTRRWWIVAGIIATVTVVGLGFVLEARDNPEASAHEGKARTTTSAKKRSTTAPPTTAAPTAAGPTGAAPTTVPPPPVEMGLAPLTGLPAPISDLQRPALVAKIDGSKPAMPQVGLDQADIVYEVSVEWGSRYLAVFHSQNPDVIGPMRSARTTDPDLLAMFGHPLFGFSGANRGVLFVLGATPWKTTVSPDVVYDAYFRENVRPWHNALMARPAVLRTVANPQVPPHPLFHYHERGVPGGGVPASHFNAYPGMAVDFDWDARLGGWRRQIWGEEHLNANGTPVAPTNVVVLETNYRSSMVDERSPEAISLGSGRAWVFSQGLVRGGSWARMQNTDTWNLRDDSGAPMPLEPGSTWVVLSERPPQTR